MWLQLVVAVVVCVVVALYVHYRQVYSRFVNTGIKYEQPIPLFGNFAASVLQTRNISNVLQDLYHKFPEEKYIGIFEASYPIILLRDPELIRQITVKDFDHFSDHRPFDSESLFGKTVFSLNGQKWRDMRATLSPAFTGSKMRGICPFTVECAQQIVQFLEEELAKVDVINGDRVLDMETRDICTRYTSDVLASVAFGLRINSVKDRHNKFYLSALSIALFPPLRLMRRFFLIAAPRLAKMINVKFFNEKTVDFFRNIVHDTMRYREDEGIYRADMINILMEAKKGTLKHEKNVSNDDAGFATVEESSVGKMTTQRKWTDDELAAQAFVFFFAGFDTVSTLLTFLTVELAVNPEVQCKLAAEIDELFKEVSEIQYEHIQKLKYLDMVMCETLRKWPPAAALDRVCVKPFVLEPPHEGGKPYQINKGEMIFMPASPIQRDPKYWPNPDRFEPERFSDANKSRVHPFTYIPFGAGPRNCIASRLSLLEMKIFVCYLVRHFELLPGPKTPNPVMVEPTSGSRLRIKDGSWLRIKSRKRNTA